jgi:DNA excision repair protein ERCC-5
VQGVRGIGVVNAVEVVHAFPGCEGLSEFRDWVMAPDAQVCVIVCVIVIVIVL